ncbi:TPA: DNA cytosine methyltransferase [Yersinia enterocolitica]|uniref:DNA cytosine methyltransferase n=1 Tax=Yersinia enterocolitica TaxID=630 RepID=UPI0021E7BFD5|nr:DNA cytosine methyltransferase [Yersinia enterocolitica]UYJ85473.1 DNA cytosine methyltransferase [Yersinia enterocolitica]UYK14853.1 DNA cytosine methyltransferase [Yersinia enterocolitica]HEN3468860.1 DNA cytosine methyltransferase [Yersinia enterocolitica]
MKEIIVDNFAGGGGASTGIEMATGRSVDIAINHDENAIAMHTTNHPDTLHYCESVFDIDPVAATSGRPVGLAWFSPDCRHFSKAKGSKPVKKEIRGLAWIVVRWALAKKPRVVMLENVEEFKTWGPLITAEDGTEHPDPARAGETFAAFVGMLTTGINAEHPALQECCEVLGLDINGGEAKRLVSGLGYVVEFRELRASDYGAPTIRKRFFMVMRCDGKPVVWPEPTHGDPKSLDVQSGHREPWRTAAECIDWSIPCPSIFERKKPLAENTLKRIARGIQRFVIDNPTPFIVKCNHTSTKTSYDCFRGQALDQPLQTITKTHGYAVAAPIIARIGQTGFGGDRMAYEASKPLTTVTSKAEHLLVTPTLIQMGYGERVGQSPRVLDMGKPLGTVTAGGNKFAVVAPIIARQFGNSIGHAIDEPNGTVTAGGGGKSQLVSAFLAKHFGGNYTGPGADLDQPAHTVTTVDHHALVTSNLIKMRGTNTGQKVTEPLQTVTAGGNHFGEVRAFLLKYYGNEKEGVSLNDPLHTVTTNDRFGLVTVEGIDYQIVDIGMRMLQPHELYAAQGFPTWYIIDRDYTGTKYAKDKQVARCGNAVPPPFAEALVRANLPEMCIERKEVAA